MTESMTPCCKATSSLYNLLGEFQIKSLNEEYLLFWKLISDTTISLSYHVFASGYIDHIARVL